MSIKKGFTIVEVLLVVVIVGIVAALGLPNYGAIKEKSLNREAKVNLGLIRAAEKIYRMESGFYYPHAAASSNIAQINTDLKLGLPESATRNWTVTLNSTAAPEFATIRRTNAGADGRVWRLQFNQDTPTCSGGTGTPNSCM